MDRGRVVRAAGARWRLALALVLVLALLTTAAGAPGPVGANTLTVINGGDTIVFAPGVTEVVLTGGELTITKSLTIEGSGVGGVTIRRSAAGGTPEFRIFTMFNFTPDPVEVALQGLTIAGGRVSGGLAGGGVFSAGVALDLRDSVLRDNSALGNYGGGLAFATGTLTLTGTTISENTTGDDGGGLALFSATTEATNTTISDNGATGSGAGIHQDGGTLTLTGSTVRDNYTLNGDGAGLYLATGTATLTGTTVAGNGSGQRGGGLYVAGGTLELSGSTVSGSSAASAGGGLYVAGGTAALANSTISDNVGAGDGGGLHNSGETTLTNTTVSGNSSHSDGGGLFNAGGAMTLRFATVTDNSAFFGSHGGIRTAGTAGNPATTTLFGSIVAGNTAGAGSECGTGAFATYSTGGYNVVGSGSGCPSGGTDDLAYGGALSALLNPTLAENGGPTRTHALPEGSPALDRVPAAQCGPANGVDQRGVPRPQPDGGACDSGTYELADYVPVVTNGDDDGPGSLRRVLAVAPPGATITFAPDVTFVTLTSGELSVIRNVTIEGHGVGGVIIERSGAGGTPAFRVFRLYVSATLRGLTIQGGSPADNNFGGGVQHSGGTLTLIDSIVTGNTADGGGGIDSTGGTVELIRTTVSSNTARTSDSGGGIYNFNSTLTLTDSIVYDNDASGPGGGIRSNGGTTTLTNSTVSGNAATGQGGGIYGAVTLRFVTVTGNQATGSGGGLATGSGDSITLLGSIVAGNTAGGSPGDCTGTVVSNGYNVVGSGTGCPSGGTGDLAHTGTLAALLSSLGYNGGPTQTHALPSGSPAIGRVPAAQCGAANGADQRGILRPQGTNCDSGAFEATGSSLVVTSGNDSGPGSLRLAIDAAPDGATITFAPGVTTVTLTSDQLTIGKNLTIQGSGVGGVTIQRSDAPGTPKFRIFEFYSELSATLRGLTIFNGDAGEDQGGGIRSNADMLALVNCFIYGNVTQAEGGGVYSATGTVTLTGTTLNANQAPGGGGGLYVNASTATLTDVSVDGNNAFNGSGVGQGGGIFNSGTLTLIRTVVYVNFAQQGGGLYNDGGTATLTNSTVSNNTGTLGGSGIYTNAGTVALRFVTVTGNQTNASGGIIGNGGTTTLFASIVAGNTPTGSGGDCQGTVTSGGYNVVGSGTGCPSNGTNDLAYTGTLTDLIAIGLSYNSGTTFNHALPPGSPAIDRVPTGQCGVAGGEDQRGVARPQGPGCDSGAFELAAYPLAVTVVGTGDVGRDTPGTGSGPFGYAPGAVVALTPQPGNGWTFVGWTVDGVYAGWAAPLTITMDAAHEVQATFALTKFFTTDVPSSHPNFAAITELASRGNILGYNASSYGPGDGVQRAQMAALIARATPFGPGTPTNGYVLPPACVADSWDCEDWGTTFTDQGGIVASLWRNAGTLQHYQVAFGYTAADCQARGRAFPCYGPTDPVSHAQTIAFITRAMIVKGYWVAQPNAPLPHPGVPSVLATEAKTYAYYTGGLPSLPSGQGWNDGATRGWFAEALWAALNSYWGTDDQLPDGGDAGGYVP